jgi:hypothetical protein
VLIALIARNALRTRATLVSLIALRSLATLVPLIALCAGRSGRSLIALRTLHRRGQTLVALRALQSGKPLEPLRPLQSGGVGERVPGRHAVADLERVGVGLETDFTAPEDRVDGCPVGGRIAPELISPADAH